MGQITITLSGSFGQHRAKIFSAEAQGHAAAVAAAIAHLASEELPEAVANDHRCHLDGLQPRDGFAGKVTIQRKQEVSNG